MFWQRRKRTRMKQLINKFIDLTSYVEIDENGKEYKKPWTLEDFLIENFYIIVGIIIGAILF